MKKRGMWVSPTEYVEFAEPTTRLSDMIATRSRSIDFYSMGMYLPNPDPILKSMGQDIRVYTELLSDAHVGGCIRRRKAAVKALERGLERGAAPARVTASIKSIFDDLPIERIINEILDAVCFGYSPLEVMWGKVGGMIVPVDVQAKPPHWFVYNQDNEFRFRSREAPFAGEEIPKYKFLVPTQERTYANPYGFPDLSRCFWPTTFKKGGLKFWVQFTEKFGTPWVIGKHSRGTPDSETDLMLDSLMQMVQDAVAVIPDDASIEIKEAAGKSGSADVFERLLHFCRSEVAIALLGQNQTTEETANKASAQVGMLVTRDIRDSDVSIVTQTFGQLIEWICELNFGTGARPVYQLQEPEQIDKRAERDAKLHSAGAVFTPQYFERQYQLQPGDVVAASAPPASSGPIQDDATFAEHDASAFPDQAALDAAVDNLAAGELDAQTGEMLRPLLDGLLAASNETEALEFLERAYPEMPTTEFERVLSDLMFAAELAGRVSAQADLQE